MNGEDPLAARLSHDLATVRRIAAIDARAREALDDSLLRRIVILACDDPDARTRLLSAAFRNHMHWSQFIGGNVVISPPFRCSDTSSPGCVRSNQPPTTAASESPLASASKATTRPSPGRTLPKAFGHTSY